MSRIFAWLWRGVSLCALVAILILLYSLQQGLPWHILPVFRVKPQLLLCAFVAVQLVCDVRIALLIGLFCWGMDSAGQVALQGTLLLFYLGFVWWLHGYKSNLRQLSVVVYLQWCCKVVVVYRLLYFMRYLVNIEVKTAIFSLFRELGSTLVFALVVYGLVVAVSGGIKEKYG